MPDTKPTEWIDLSKEEIIRRKDAVISQLAKQIEEMDKDAKSKARDLCEAWESLSDSIAEICGTTSSVLETCAKQLRRGFGIEKKKSEED